MVEVLREGEDAVVEETGIGLITATELEDMEVTAKATGPVALVCIINFVL